MASVWLLMLVAMGTALARQQVHLTHRREGRDSKLEISADGSTGVQNADTRREGRDSQLEISVDGSTGVQNVMKNIGLQEWAGKTSCKQPDGSPDTTACQRDCACQRPDGVLSGDLEVTSSSFAGSPLDIVGGTDEGKNKWGKPKRWCQQVKNDWTCTEGDQACHDKNKEECEERFTFINCKKSDGHHTVYYPCTYDPAGRSGKGSRKHCYANMGFTAPEGVLLKDGTKHAETCVGDHSHRSLNGTAGDKLYKAEHCVSGETMEGEGQQMQDGECVKVAPTIAPPPPPISSAPEPTSPEPVPEDGDEHEDEDEEEEEEDDDDEDDEPETGVEKGE